MSKMVSYLVNGCRVLLPLFIFSFHVANAYAEIYKCRNDKGGTEFSDKPCRVGSVTVSISENLYPSTQSSFQPQTNSPNAYQSTLDHMVDEAIGTGDLRRAKELALTSDHWEKIRLAETPTQKSDAELKIQQANSDECSQAKRSYQLEAGAIRQNESLINSKKRLMYSACGMAEPNSVNIRNSVKVYR